MAKSREELEADVIAAIAPGFRARLIARGQARAMIWRDGALPPEAPEFSPLLTYDLRTYGYALLEVAFRLREMGGDENTVRRAFEQAATAIEATVSNANPAERDRTFHLVIAGAAYHLGRFSARAYSLLTRLQAENVSPLEQALVDLMLRNIVALRTLAIDYQLAGRGSDASVAAYLNEQVEAAHPDNLQVDRDGDSFAFEAVNRAITSVFFEAIATYLLALERGEQVLVERAIGRLQVGREVCGELNLIPQWWAYKVAIHLLGGIWEASFHNLLPIIQNDNEAGDWQRMKETFVALLLCRGRAEVDLWPSQIAAASRALNQGDDLVVSLPTSAGKTRIAELCILRCLAGGKRVVFVTPLRALSAQTEVTLQRTFVPLGKTVSALYGSIGVSGFDEDAISSEDIVVATPEKLDFAIRNDPTLIDDVGLLIFDEGHMIGLGEREVRYEVQIQRLLKRPDASQRRIVCLSAVLPTGDQMEDFTNWLRRDQPGGAIASDWRPTGLHFGEVVWGANAARLNLRIGDERPFIPRFLVARVPPIGRRRKVFPNDLGELCLATAWRLVEEGQSVLIFCPVRAHVEPFAVRIVDLSERGVLPNLLNQDPSVLATALSLGSEWLGEEHPILQCLRLGVAIHHGALPTAFRKEIERLLREGVLKVTISSPTLAQGLNLSATTVLMHSLHRDRQRISSSEFRNVIGRAGRAFVDVRGLVLYPIFDRAAHRTREWEELIDDTAGREMESGLLRLVLTLTLRMHRSLGSPPIQQLIDYVLNNVAAWTFPVLPNESAEIRERESASWEGYIASLDTAILSLMGNAEVEVADVEATLDEILASSLWQRRLARRQEATRNALKAGLVSRAQYLWRNSTARQRKGYFLAGVGLRTGAVLDQRAADLNDLLVRANGAAEAGDEDAAIEAVTRIAEVVFEIPPFRPDALPANWREILELWLRGRPLADEVAHQGAQALQFIEGGLVYRLPWAMEAIRVRAIANADAIGADNVSLEDLELRMAVAAVETGTLNRSAAILIQAGFTSRIGAIRAVTDTNAQFRNGFELRQWLDSGDVNLLTDLGDWPTVETASVWRDFRSAFSPSANTLWNTQERELPVTWLGDVPEAGSPVGIYDRPGETAILLPQGELTGTLDVTLNPHRKGLVRASVSADQTGVLISYIGPQDLMLQ